MSRGGRASRIRFDVLRVLTSIQLNDNHPFKADEIKDVVAERVLASKFAVVELSPAQALPKQALGAGRTVAQVALKL